MNRVVILGAGTFGSSIAEMLASENQVTLVDNDDSKLANLRGRIDARFIKGDATSPITLTKAGCDNADVILAVTSIDIVNLSACKICNTLFDNSDSCTRIARCRNKELSGNADLLEAFGVSEAYNAEELVADAVVGILDFDGTRKVFKYWDGDLNVLLIKIKEEDTFIGQTISEWQEQNSELGFAVFVILRNDETIKAVASQKLLANDELLIATKGSDAMQAINKGRKTSLASKKIFIAGGGTIGEEIASKIEDKYDVTLIEPDQQRCVQLLHSLNSTVVDCGDPTDSNMLRNEDIENAQYFCAVTENDEMNIISALLAKQLGCAKAAVLIGRNSYQKVLLDHSVDTIISPSEKTFGVLHKALASRQSEQIDAIDNLGAHLLAFTVQQKAKICGKEFNSITWPENVIPVALGSGDKSKRIIFPNSTALTKVNDSVIVFVTDKNDSTLNDLRDIPFFA